MFKLKVSSNGNTSICGYTGDDEDLIIPEIVDGKVISSILSDAFTGNKKIKSITINHSLFYIGKKAFFNSSIKKVNINASVNTICEYCFASSDVEDIKINSGLVRICKCAFKGCSALNNINIPSTCSVIEDGVFDSTPFKSKGSIIDNVLINVDCNTKTLNLKDVRIITTQACINSKISSLNITDSVEFIGNRAFFGNNLLEYVIFPEQSCNMGNSVFNSCHNLRQVVLPDTMIQLPASFLNGCRNLERIDIPDYMQRLCTNSLYGCENLRSINLNNIIKIDDLALSKCYKLKFLQASRLKVLGNYAFSGCTSLDTVVFDSIEVIGDYAFNGCTNLKRIHFPKTLQEITTKALDNSAIEYISCSRETKIKFYNNNIIVERY